MVTSAFCWNAGWSADRSALSAGQVDELVILALESSSDDVGKLLDKLRSSNSAEEYGRRSYANRAEVGLRTFASSAFFPAARADWVRAVVNGVSMCIVFEVSEMARTCSANARFAQILWSTMLGNTVVSCTNELVCSFKAELPT